MRIKLRMFRNTPIRNRTGSILRIPNPKILNIQTFEELRKAFLLLLCFCEKYFDTEMSSSEEKSIIQPCSFQFHDFVTQVGEMRIASHVVKMEDSVYLWIGDKNRETMDDLAFAFPSKYESQPIATKLMGPVADTTSNNIAKRLTKKFGKPIYVSFNVQADNLSLPGIEKSVQEELKKCLDVV